MYCRAPNSLSLGALLTERRRLSHWSSLYFDDDRTKILQYYRLGHRKYFKLQRTPEAGSDEVIYDTGEGVVCGMPNTLGEWLKVNEHLWTNM